MLNPVTRGPAAPPNVGASLKPAAVSIVPTPPRSPRWGLALTALTGVVVLALAGFVISKRMLEATSAPSDATFALPNAELPEALPDPALQKLQGTWLMSDCNPSKGQPWSTELNSNAGQLTESKRVFLENGCRGELYTLVVSKSLISLKSVAGGQLEAEYRLDDAAVIVREAAPLNQDRFLGMSDWKSGVERSVLGPMSAKLFSRELRSGAATYDLLQLEPQRLFASTSAELALTQPSDINPKAWVRLN